MIEHLKIQLKERSCAQGENNKSNPSCYVKRPPRRKPFNV